MSIRVVLADNHELLRQGLKALLEREGIQVIGEAADGQEAIRLVTDLNPDIVILDISMPLLNGLNVSRELNKSSQKAKTIVLTRHQEDQYVTEALRVGVKGYVLKSQAARDLIQAIHQVYSGGVYLCPGISRAVVDAFLSKTDLSADPLTSREHQVLQLVVEGNSSKDVARLLGISPKTAESHRMRLMRKLNIHETASLVRYAIRHGYVQP
jgi:two-component system response regulator NreC